MGFFKFLKREKKAENGMDDLDLPPAPPRLDDSKGMKSGADLDFPDLGAEDKSNDMLKDFDISGKDLDFPDLGVEELPPLPETEKKMTATRTGNPEEEMPELFASAAIQEPTSPADVEDMPENAEPADIGETEVPIQKPARRLFGERRNVRMHAKTDVYVRADRFKNALEDISAIRSSLRKSEEALIRLEHVKGSKDRSFDRFKSSLDDLQRKLIFVDRTLFKGDQK